MNVRSRSSFFVLLLLSCALVLAASRPAHADDEGSTLKQLHTVSTVASTVPANGDINPYGVAQVRKSVGNLVAGNILVSNFNNSANAQGTGTTIVQMSPEGGFSQFAAVDASNLPGPCPGGVGLTTALVVLKSGWVIVGSLPTSDGTSATAQAGCLIVLNSHGKAVETLWGTLINGPWDMTSFERGDDAMLFVTNVLNGTVAANGNVVNRGTVLRINLEVAGGRAPRVTGATVIGSGFAEHTDPAALVIGPTGVALSAACDTDDEDDCTPPANQDGERVLYVADTVNNRITAIPNPLVRNNSAGTGVVVTENGSLNGPLGIAVSPDGHIFAVNSSDGFITEITPRGAQIAKKLLDNTAPVPTGGAGALFGLAITNHGKTIYFVDDISNTLGVVK